MASEDLAVDAFEGILNCKVEVVAVVDSGDCRGEAEIEGLENPPDSRCSGACWGNSEATPDLNASEDVVVVPAWEVVRVWFLPPVICSTRRRIA